MIVSEVPGTTRDSVDVRFEKEGKTLIVIDTAGVRKKRHMVTNDIEFYSFHRAERSIRRADVVLMLIDATEPVSEPDKKLAAVHRRAAQAGRPRRQQVGPGQGAGPRAAQGEGRAQGVRRRRPELMEEFREYLDEELKHLDYAPIAFITAKDKRNVQTVLDLAQHLFKQATERVTTHKLNEASEQIMEERSPSTPSGRRARVYYATQTDVAPPTIVLFVNNPDVPERDVPAVHGQPLPRAAAVRRSADPPAHPRPRWRQAAAGRNCVCRSRRRRAAERGCSEENPLRGKVRCRSARRRNHWCVARHPRRCGPARAPNPSPSPNAPPSAAPPAAPGRARVQFSWWHGASPMLSGRTHGRGAPVPRLESSSAQLFACALHPIP